MSLFAVVCQWTDRRGKVDVSGHEALVIEAANANDAEKAAYAARPDLWENQGEPHFYRDLAVHPATKLPDAALEDHKATEADDPSTGGGS